MLAFMNRYWHDEEMIIIQFDAPLIISDKDSVAIFLFFDELNVSYSYIIRLHLINCSLISPLKFSKNY